MAKAFGDEEGDQTSEQVFNFKTLRNRSLNRRLLGFSIKDAFKMSGVYSLPFGGDHALLGRSSHGFLSKLVSDWQTGWVLTMQSGSPIGITVAGNTFNNSGGATAVPLADIPANLGSVSRVASGVTYFNGYNVVADPIVQTYSADFRSRSTLRAIADPSGRIILVNPAVGTLGYLSTRPLVGPGIFNLDLNLIRTFRLQEGLQFQIRADATSVTNTPQWGNPNLNINSTNFGANTSAGGNRIVTLEGRIRF